MALACLTAAVSLTLSSGFLEIVIEAGYFLALQRYKQSIPLTRVVAGTYLMELT